MFNASGSYYQKIICFPELDVVVVVTAGDDLTGLDTFHLTLDPVLEKVILAHSCNRPVLTILRDRLPPAPYRLQSVRRGEVQDGYSRGVQSAGSIPMVRPHGCGSPGRRDLPIGRPQRNDGYPTRLSLQSPDAGRMGKAANYLVAAVCILAPRGRLNVSTSIVDDEGVDLVFHLTV